jgi:hypothetical protein
LLLVRVHVVFAWPLPIIGLESVVTLLRHLLAGTIDDISRVGVAGLFHIAVLTVPIWVSICHELSL